MEIAAVPNASGCGSGRLVGSPHPFSTALAAGSLVRPVCTVCGAGAAATAWVCAVCGGTALAWLPADPNGRVFAVTTVWRTPMPSMTALTPFTLVLADLQGWRLMGHGEPGLAIGDPVIARIAAVAGQPLVRFGRPAAEARR